MYDEALACLDRAIELHPGYAKAWYNRDLIFMALCRGDDADAAFSQAQKLEVSESR